MPTETKTDSKTILLELIARSVFGNSGYVLPETAILSEVFKESCDQTVIALAFDALNAEKAISLDEDTYNKWQQTAASVLSGNIRNQFADCELHKILSEAGIPHCTIKGNASAAYYPKPHLRQMGDIDFLVNECDFERTLKLLESRGFKAEENNHKFHIGLKKNGTVYELHKQISYLPKNQEYVFELTSNLISDSVIYKTELGEIRIPDKFCHGITLLLHMQRHIMNGEGIGLRHLFDWAVFADSFTDSEFRDCFENSLRSVGLWRFAQLMGMVSSIYLKMPYKKWIGDIDSELAADIMDDIFDGGNFGHKKYTERVQDSIMISKTGENHSAPVNVLLSLCKKIYIWKPFYEKHKYLLPIGFITYAVRILWQIIFNKKKVDLAGVAVNGRKRDILYKKFELFKK